MTTDLLAGPASPDGLETVADDAGGVVFFDPGAMATRWARCATADLVEVSEYV